MPKHPCFLWQVFGECAGNNPSLEHPCTYEHKPSQRGVAGETAASLLPRTARYDKFPANAKPTFEDLKQLAAQQPSLCRSNPSLRNKKIMGSRSSTELLMDILVLQRFYEAVCHQQNKCINSYATRRRQHLEIGGRLHLSYLNMLKYKVFSSIIHAPPHLFNTTTLASLDSVDIVRHNNSGQAVPAATGTASTGDGGSPAASKDGAPSQHSATEPAASTTTPAPLDPKAFDDACLIWTVFGTCAGHRGHTFPCTFPHVHHRKDILERYEPNPRRRDLLVAVAATLPLHCVVSQLLAIAHEERQPLEVILIAVVREALFMLRDISEAELLSQLDDQEPNSCQAVTLQLCFTVEEKERRALKQRLGTSAPNLTDGYEDDDDADDDDDDLDVALTDAVAVESSRTHGHEHQRRPQHQPHQHRPFDDPPCPAWQLLGYCPNKANHSSIRCKFWHARRVCTRMSPHDPLSCSFWHGKRTPLSQDERQSAVQALYRCDASQLHLHTPTVRRAMRESNIDPPEALLAIVRRANQLAGQQRSRYRTMMHKLDHKGPHSWRECVEAFAITLHSGAGVQLPAALQPRNSAGARTGGTPRRPGPFIPGRTSTEDEADMATVVPRGQWNNDTDTIVRHGPNRTAAADDMPTIKHQPGPSSSSTHKPSPSSTSSSSASSSQRSSSRTPASPRSRQSTSTSSSSSATSSSWTATRNLRNAQDTADRVAAREKAAAASLHHHYDDDDDDDGDGGAGSSEPVSSPSESEENGTYGQVLPGRNPLANLIDGSELDICFLLDTTGGMESHFEAVQHAIEFIACQLKDAHVQPAGSGSNHVRFSLVAYTDFTDVDVPVTEQTRWIEPTSDLNGFLAHMNSLKPKGGFDYVEDVKSGLQCVRDHIPFRDGASRLLLHIADAPCHGRRFYNTSLVDHAADADPEEVLELVRWLAKEDVFYAFCAIKDSQRRDGSDFSTTKMFQEFDAAYSAASATGARMLWTDVTQVDRVLTAVTQAIASSVSSMSLLAEGVHSLQLNRRAVVMDSGQIDFSAVPAVRCTCSSMKSPLFEDLPQITLESFELTRQAPRMVRVNPLPFSSGTFRLAHHASSLFKGREPKPEVAKRSIFQARSKQQEREECLADLREQCVAAVLARKFNQRLVDKKRKIETGVRGNSINFAKAKLIKMNASEKALAKMASLLPEGQSASDVNGFWLLEVFMSESYFKYSNNGGKVRGQDKPDGQLVHAFSHWTYENTGRRFLVADLQGTCTDLGVFLTDPVVHDARDARLFARGDRGMRGIRDFFSTHKCNHVCKKLGLHPTPQL